MATGTATGIETLAAVGAVFMKAAAVLTVEADTDVKAKSNGTGRWK